MKAVGAQGLGSHPTLFLQEGNVISGLCAGQDDGHAEHTRIPQFKWIACVWPSREHRGGEPSGTDRTVPAQTYWVLLCRTSGPVVSDPKSSPNNVEIYSVKSSNSATLATHLNLLQNMSLAKENTSVDQAPIHLLCFIHTETLRPTVDPDSDTPGFKLWQNLCSFSVWILKILFYRLEAGQTFPQLHF